MILHTIISEDDIFFQPQEYTKEVMQKNSMCIECSILNGERKVERIFSTNPADYINNAYLPGSRI